MSASGGGGQWGPPGGGPGAGPQPGWPGPGVPPQPGRGPYPPGPYPPGPYPPGPYPGPYPPGPYPPPEPSRGRRIARFIFNPIYAAQRVFRPSRPGLVEDPTVRKLQLWRTLLGIVAWVCLMITYSTISDVGDAKNAAIDRTNQSWISVLVLVCTFPVVVGAFVAAARGGLRRVYLRRALRSLGAVLALMASMATFPLAMAPDSEGLRDFVGVPGKVVIAVLTLWSLGFALYGIGLALVHVFRTADIHEMVPPMLATLLVWEMAVMDLITGAYENVPPLARIGFVLGAPVTVTALSCWEVYRLRHRHGLSLRGALGL